MTAARLSERFRTLFPAGVVAAELQGTGDVRTLLPAETDCLGASVPQRAAEFAAGRQCAQLALSQLGIRDFALRAAPDQRPIWPASIVGSITHTRGLCAAVVAAASRMRGLGVDVETIASLRAELWPRICVSGELAWIESLPVPGRAAAAALLFAAKEAFYKAQSPLTDQWLNFKDLHVQAADFAAQAQTGAALRFEVIPVRSLKLQEIVTPPYTGCFRIDAEFVSAGVALGA